MSDRLAELSPKDAAVAAVIVNYQTADLALQSLDALRVERESIPGLKVILVDGGSEDGSAEKLARSVDVDGYRDWVAFLPLPINGGFGWANNQAVLHLAQQTEHPDFIYFLNPDAQVLPGAATSLLRDLHANPRAGAAGSQLLDGTGQAVPSAFRFPSVGRELMSGAQWEVLGRVFGIAPTVVQSSQSVDVDWVTGASVMFRSEALRQVGLFDDGFFLYFEEVELMQRLHVHGWTVRHVPASHVTHYEGSSTGISEKVAQRRLPAYWYKSRRRYFAIVNGSLVSVAASLALIVGCMLRTAKTMIGRSSQGGASVTDLLHHGVWPTAADRCRSAPRLGDRPGARPFWMMGN